MNFTSMQSPAVLGLGQKIYRTVGAAEMGAIPRWGVFVGLTAYWFVEPTFERFKPAPPEGEGESESDK